MFYLQLIICFFLCLLEDKIWYRAVILEVDENEIGVIYADYGNIEKVPRSRILPIPDRLLQLPFPVTRCTLTGKAHCLWSFTNPTQGTLYLLVLKNVFNNRNILLSKVRKAFLQSGLRKCSRCFKQSC